MHQIHPTQSAQIFHVISFKIDEPKERVVKWSWFHRIKWCSQVFFFFFFYFFFAHFSFNKHNDNVGRQYGSPAVLSTKPRNKSCVCLFFSLLLSALLVRLCIQRAFSHKFLPFLQPHGRYLSMTHRHNNLNLLWPLCISLSYKDSRFSVCFDKKGYRSWTELNKYNVRSHTLLRIVWIYEVDFPAAFFFVVDKFFVRSKPNYGMETIIPIH